MKQKTITPVSATYLPKGYFDKIKKPEPTPDLFPSDAMPFNLAGEAMPEMTSEEWESHCRTFAEENRRKIRETHANRNSTAPFNR